MTATTTLLRDQKIYFDAYDLTGSQNSVALAYGADQLDATVLGNDTHVFTAGLKTVSASMAGFTDYGGGDAALFATIAAATAKPLTICATGTAGALALFFKANQAKYDITGKDGALLSYQLDATAADKLIRGTLMENQAAAITTADGTGRQVGAVSASQSIYAALHVFAIGGTASPTLTVNLDSDTTNAFVGAETTRLTFAPVTAIGSQYISLAGAVTDTWWKPEWIISGTNPTFQLVLVTGIQ